MSILGDYQKRKVLKIYNKQANNLIKEIMNAERKIRMLKKPSDITSEVERIITLRARYQEVTLRVGIVMSVFSER